MSAIFGFTFHIGRMTEVLTPDIYRAHWSKVCNQGAYIDNNRSGQKYIYAQEHQLYCYSCIALQLICPANTKYNPSNVSWHGFSHKHSKASL